MKFLLGWEWEFSKAWSSLWLNSIWGILYMVFNLKVDR